MHKEKILRKYTIVPKNLYVNRKADKHLKIIIHEMLKPGYVSVSRQMGKSNLLINAKLELENENNILLYLDCSTPAETSRECFRNFIDVLLENYNDKFDEAAFEIVKKRKELNLTPAKEHENELKILLKYFKGNLIFILDEVDALAKVDYSDEIFAQIRSIYFTRIQTKNFDRLTYILSGVIDPNKLIKNKDNSPFNIADKITLDDFNRNEYDDFIKKTGLELATEVIDRIYYWTNGNPRITYDLCSELEDIILENDTQIEKNTIDELVELLYFRKFDKAPVDHIRETVQQNVELRRAVNNLHHNKGESLSDEIINRLYLVGIISGNLNNNSLEIKNRIIEKSLSLEWIERIELESQGYFNIGEEKYNKGEYLESIRYFNDFIKNTKEITLNELNRTHSYLAYSYFNLKEYDLALNEYSKILYNKEKESESYYLIIFEMGACNLYLSRYEKSIKLFTEFITNPNLNYERRISAVSNIGYNLLSLNRKDEALMKFKEVELGLESFEDEEHSLNTLRLVNYKNLYICDSNNAKEYCEKAIDCAVNVKNKLHFLLKLYTLTDDVKYIDEVLDLIFIHKLSFEELTPLNIEFDVKSFYDLFAITYFLNHRFDEISKYFLERDNIIYVEFLYSVAIYVVNNDFSTKKIKIILLDIANYENDLISENTKYIIVDVFRRLCIIFHNDKNESKFIQFARKFALVFEGDNSKITNADVFIFFHLSQKMLFSNSNGADIIYFLSIIENKIDIDNMDLNIMCNYIFILFIFIQTYINSKNKKEAEEYAVKLLNIVKKVKHQANKVDISQYNSILSMEESAKRVLNPQIKPLIVPKKYGRNDIVTVQYTDGNIQHGKYKKFEEDILKYICVII